MRSVSLLFFALVLSIRAACAAPLPVYTDALQSSFQNYSYGGGSNFANATPAFAGTSSIAFNGNNFNAMSFALVGQTLSSAQYQKLHFWLHGGIAGGQQLRVYLQLNNSVVLQAPISAAITGGAAAANTWREVTIDFDQAAFSYSGGFDRIDLQSDVGGTQPVLYVDEVELIERATVVIDPIFSSGFEGSAPAPGGITIERDVSSGGMSSDRFSYKDYALLPRVLGLAHPGNAAGPGGSFGGEMREYRYSVGGAARTVLAPPSSAGGFGYIVSHRGEGSNGIGVDDSPLGHGISGGAFARVFEGRHHVIHRFTLNYPRWASTTAAIPNQLYSIPVTIEWMLSEGRSYPLWAISYDLSGTPANAIEGDSRAPYGEMLFDGAASQGAHSVITGVAWGDRYRFSSTSAPVSYQSAWTWNTPNTIPHVQLWTSAVDAEMGTVQTQTIQQQDAGGYYGTNRWNTTSAAGNACTDAGAVSLMPCSYNWPYQSINYSLGGAAAPTNNTRLAWGANFGFLGQTSYRTHGSAYWGGPLPDTTASGWPRKSYSTFVVLDTHSSGAVLSAVREIEAVQQTVLSASVGSVASSGPAGVNRSDSVSYQPAGWNHVYAAWSLSASANALSATFVTSGANALKHPLLQIGNYTAALEPTVRWDGVTLSADTDYFLSRDLANNRLWITLLRDVSGSHSLQLGP
jgi:hypothetical protein